MTRTDRTISSTGGGHPDWDSGAPITLTSSESYTVLENGYIGIVVTDSPSYRSSNPTLIKVNNKEVWRSHYYGGDPSRVYEQTSVIPVSVGDVVTKTDNQWTTEVTFYPLK